MSTTTTTTKKRSFHLRRRLATVVDDFGCGCRPRRRPKLPSLFTTSTSQSSSSSKPSSSSSSAAGRVTESVAVVKESEDPYVDFRNSMLQMIVEKEIYSFDDLRELLDCFLSLNSPYHHEAIVTAFMEIWNGVFVNRCKPT
ncbi:hypothetical protein QJS10_CPB13g01529 [Acorus calamus]|uniref:Transcription repressor n=1 Tax=Acorus calamus TaxID=4465 RepID=A0AAV9DKD5_ACOCL|nr:hypothetical protein QJS10_CPB13g01529 [Acorus calamus]